MKKAPIQPLNNNIVVRRLKSSTASVDSVKKVGAIYVPQESNVSDTPTEEVEIVAISADIKPFAGTHLGAKVGDRALIQKGLGCVKFTREDEEFLVIGYVNLIGIVA